MKCLQSVRNGELLELLAWGQGELLRAGIEEGREECERVMMKLLRCSRAELFLKEHETDPSGIRNRFLEILEKRTKRVPLAYLLKETDFWHETLLVDERCLIPRPETEILVEQVLKNIGEMKKEKFSFLDLGTGSGAIAIAILRACGNATATMTDISGGALEAAFENLKRYGLENRAEIVPSDLFRAFTDPKKWDLIVSNPPYLSEKDLKEAQEELRYEPRMALDGGKDGLDFYRAIIAQAKDLLTAGGLIGFEVGAGQAETVSKWFQEAGYDNIQRFRDHLGIERVVMARRKN
ncbi:MAG TPA: peptide chain release factor N(5)-glutamine methyltransferase [Candidatus Omnitrophota bacterium]|nr:peptide chain release factor N(5)-glutamine methyltransferase [Candidatus Omnitrophota bacterium]HRY85038.1 peptide chain release factor N(5)-glutamine methyltransferase [Candidatus Omnitrophota bacterium]